MNDVPVDEVALTAEADAAIAGMPATESPADAGALAALESWATMIESVTPILRIGVFPQWNISDGEAKEFADSLGQCLDQLFPGGMGGKYACYARFIACCGGIAALRAIQNQGKLPPIGPKRIEKPKDESTGVDAPH